MAVDNILSNIFINPNTKVSVIGWSSLPSSDSFSEISMIKVNIFDSTECNWHFENNGQVRFYHQLCGVMENDFQKILLVIHQINITNYTFICLHIYI